MLQQTPQTSQTHNAISFWLERVSRANLQCFASVISQKSHLPVSLPLSLGRNVPVSPAMLTTNVINKSQSRPLCP